MEALPEEFEQLIETCRIAKSKDFELKTSEYIDEKLGISPTDLTTSGAETLDFLSEYACLMNLSNTDYESLCCSAYHLEKNSKAAQVRLLKVDRELKLIEKYMERLEKKQKMHEKFTARVISRMEEKRTDAASSLNHSKILKQKADQYNHKIKIIQENLQKNGFKDEYSHENIAKLSEEVKRLDKQLEPLKSKLSAYKELPPDITLLRIKVEETKRKVESLEKEISEKIGSLQLYLT
ncbi:DgyrCDS13822 [Dimorphilus gyrociliatus]|uniref:DgyrCDS13822 n=1 Tax=Dimorphilus gyrociliatus TaxID=2664684 RepID=A0A7I8WBU8_9ANNE|nr:DgyrCDS13822 [Dimorphilus gyrociliatus]